MSTKLHYVIVDSPFRSELERLVNARIDAGFKPCGGLISTSDRDDLGNENRMFYQAMTYAESP